MNLTTTGLQKKLDSNFLKKSFIIDALFFKEVLEVSRTTATYNPMPTPTQVLLVDSVDFS